MINEKRAEEISKFTEDSFEELEKKFHKKVKKKKKKKKSIKVNLPTWDEVEKILKKDKKSKNK